MTAAEGDFEEVCEEDKEEWKGILETPLSARPWDDGDKENP